MDSLDYKLDGTVPTDVIISHDGDEKYVIGIVTPLCTSDDEGTSGEQEKDIMKYVLVSTPHPYHADITMHYNYSLDKEDFEPIGGGILTIDREKKYLKTYGRSGAYGPPPRNLLEYIIKKHFPDFETDITITNYIRG